MMASSFIPKPGTAYGPCNDGCKHRDCIAAWKTINTLCRICKEAISWERHYYQEEDWAALVHAVCLEQEVEDERKQAESS